MKRAKKIGLALLAVLMIAGVGAGVVAFRVIRVVRVAQDFEQQVRYLIENGGTIGEAPAKETFSTDYLEAIFGDNPDLLDQLKSIVQKGLSDEPSLNLGEVSAMIVTYNKSPEDKVENVVAHVWGGFPLGKMKLGFHRDGYFAKQIDRNLWNVGNVVISFLGRDMILFAEDSVAEAQHELLESLFSGDITPLVKGLAKPMFFTAVFPDPKRVVPSQLRGHIQAVVLKGSLGYQKGHFENLFLCPNQKSASYAYGIISDMKKIAILGLKTRWGGSVMQTAWGPMVGNWWAYEMVKTLEETKVQTEEILVRMNVEFGRVMVNACLKTVERMSRDLAALKGTFEDRLDPRVVDARLATQKPLHYWSEPHQWGPDWPIPPPATNDQIVLPGPETTNAPITTAQTQPAPPASP